MCFPASLETYQREHWKLALLRPVALTARPGRLRAEEILLIRRQVLRSDIASRLCYLKIPLPTVNGQEVSHQLSGYRQRGVIGKFNTGARVVSREEEERLIRNAAPFMQDLIRFGLNTGLRTGEIFSLRWSNVDVERNVLNVFANKTDKIRTVPINAEARIVLNLWAQCKKNEYVFYNHQTGKPFVGLKAGFALACPKGGIDGVTWHTLRHTFASRLLNRGVDIVTVQQLLGHSTVTVTMRYTHTNLDSKKAAVAKLCDNLVTVAPNCGNANLLLSQMRPKSKDRLELKTEEWVSG